MDDYFIMVDFPNYRSLWILLFYEAVGLLLLFKEHPVRLYPSQKTLQKQNKTKTPPKKPWDSLMSFFFFFLKTATPAGGFFGRFVGLFIVLCEVITHAAPQGEPDTRQTDSLAVTKREKNKEQS